MSEVEHKWVPPFRVVPQEHESLKGLLLRLCDVHAWPTLNHFCRLLGTTPAAIRRGDDVGIIAEALSIPVDALEDLAPKQISSKVIEYFGHRLPRTALEKRRKACPECVRGEGHAKWWWELKYLETCPDHGLALVDRCGCGKPLSWNDASRNRCRDCTASGKRTELQSVHAHMGSFERWCMTASYPEAKRGKQQHL
jgi:hypothetical protein